MYVTNVVNTCMALNNTYYTTIVQFSFATFYCFSCCQSCHCFSYNIYSNTLCLIKYT